eukprot:TRINITY_DN1286_c0_g1_i1.p4 TRINITY_DN1286_c0_g1~~TRINITY_DN1286_c0_g1_i1.p4  ORF type:complete len:156 (-),score=23.31 TRINITY_DN1286_c0_g1_i1:1293-1760(-)
MEVAAITCVVKVREFRRCARESLYCERCIAVVGLGGRGKSTLVRDWLNCVGHGDLARQVYISNGRQGTTKPESNLASVGGVSVMITDCVGAETHGIESNDVASADVLVVFLGDSGRCDAMHADLLLWAWRMRADMRTMFVLPKCDDWRNAPEYRQ